MARRVREKERNGLKTRRNKKKMKYKRTRVREKTEHSSSPSDCGCCQPSKNSVAILMFFSFRFQIVIFFYFHSSFFHNSHMFDLMWYLLFRCASVVNVPFFHLFHRMYQNIILYLYFAVFISHFLSFLLLIYALYFLVDFYYTFAPLWKWQQWNSTLATVKNGSCYLLLLVFFFVGFIFVVAVFFFCFSTSCWFLWNNKNQINIDLIWNCLLYGVLNIADIVNPFRFFLLPFLSCRLQFTWELMLVIKWMHINQFR